MDLTINLNKKWKHSGMNGARKSNTQTEQRERERQRGKWKHWLGAIKQTDQSNQSGDDNASEHRAIVLIALLI